MYILGISCFYHDAAAALLQDGVLVAAAEEERFSRIKHDSDFPHHAIEFCLRQAGITKRELDFVVFYEKPLQKFERILTSTLQAFPQSYRLFRESMLTWLTDKLWIKRVILMELDIPNEKLFFVEHHLSHAASAFFCSPFEEAAVLTVDGVGERVTATIGRATADWGTGARNIHDARPSNAIDLFGEIRFPNSLGLLYSAFTAFLGFQVNEGEYKVMGMAPYGDPKRLDDVYKLIHVYDDGSFELDMSYFDFHRSIQHSYGERFRSLFGEPRVSESAFYTLLTHPHKEHPQWNDRLAQQNQAYADIAASIQRVTEDVLLRMAIHAYHRTGSKRLCIAGGVALNSVANGRIQRELPFEEVWIQPAAGDSGGAVGAALYVYHVLLGYPRRFVMEHAYW
jgi:carbamoyltransferase